MIYTRMRNLPASRINGATLEHCLVADGCVIGAGTRIERCLIGVRSRDRRGMRDPRHGDDRRRPLRDRRGAGARTREPAGPNLDVGDGAVIERAILDKDCRIGRGVKLINRDSKQDVDGPNGIYYIRDGIICVPPRRGHPGRHGGVSPLERCGASSCPRLVPALPNTDNLPTVPAPLWRPPCCAGP